MIRTELIAQFSKSSSPQAPRIGNEKCIACRCCDGIWRNEPRERNAAARILPRLPAFRSEAQGNRATARRKIWLLTRSRKYGRDSYSSRRVALQTLYRLRSKLRRII